MSRLRLAAVQLIDSARASITVTRPQPRHLTWRLKPCRAYALMVSSRLVPMTEKERKRNDSASQCEA